MTLFKGLGPRTLAASVEEMAALAAENATLAEEKVALARENALLRERIEALERRLGLHSANSSKPPSSDGPGKPPAARRARSLRGKSGRKSGGQKGHKGTTLRRVALPDHVEDHYPARCPDCGSALSAQDVDGPPVLRQIFDLPEPRPAEVTEHRAHRCRCQQCGASTRAPFPEEVAAPVQYGPRITAAAVYLSHAHYIPEDRLSQLMSDLFHIPVCAATLAAMVARTAERLEVLARHVQDLIVATAPVKHLDETGVRVAGKTWWLHVACTPGLSSFRVDPRRGEMLPGLTGRIVHDHWKPYFKIDDIEHCLCNTYVAASFMLRWHKKAMLDCGIE